MLATQALCWKMREVEAAARVLGLQIVPLEIRQAPGYRVARQRRVASERVPAIGITVSGATEEERQCAKRQLQPYCLHWESFPSSRRAPTQWSPCRPVCGQP